MPTQYKPFLEVFTFFSQLPIEIRVIIWQLTIKPRVVELCYDTGLGFYSQYVLHSLCRCEPLR